jgi:penicillin-binding protein 2
MTNSEPELKKFFLYSVLILVFFILALQFYRLQISQASIYYQKSFQNSVKMVTRFPVRGNIYDRDGTIIVDNRPAFSLYLIPASVTDNTLEKVSHLSKIPVDEIRSEIEKAGKFQPVKVMRQVDIKKLTWIQENILDLPGVEWKTEPKRHYIRSSGLAHLLGTLGEVDERELSDFSSLEPGDMLGKKAIERVFDKELRGNKGFRFVKVDAMGRIVEQISSSESVLPQPGNHLYLTIDYRLQTYADTLMSGKRGVMISIDPRNGDILTLLSKPDYDINDLSGVISEDIWDRLLNDPHHPLYDRACQSGYPPGSTYKLVAAIAALNENIITPAWKINCPGFYRLGRKTIKCWKPKGHGTLNLEEAIKNSCNVYFYRLGLLIGLDVWNKYSKLFYFGQKTGVELTNENPGLVPSLEYYDKIYGKGGWTKGMLANLAVGQGELLVTPLQLAQFASILANKGVLHQPHIGLYFVNPVTEKKVQISGRSSKISEIQDSVLDIILEGMRKVVAGGTGWRAGVYGITGAGKTGTAQNPHGEDHAWYIGFAPYEEPEIVVCVLVENGGSGGGVAAPIAGAYLKRYFHFQGKYDYEAEKRRLALAARRDSLKIDSSQVSTTLTEDSIRIENEE